MKKNIWIINHYAADMFFQKGGRHFWFAKELKKKGYSPTIICASTLHDTKDSLNMLGQRMMKIECDNVPFIFIEAKDYEGNGLQRLKNIVSFSVNARRELYRYGKDNPPDLILASSVHPLTCLVGCSLSKKFGVPCISEIRDLWPEELIDMGAIKRRSLVASVLYAMEHWIYSHSNAVVFTIEGGKQYIIDRRWDRDTRIDLNKVFYINNGYSAEDFQKHMTENDFADERFESDNSFKVAYTGAIRRANGVDRIVEIAKQVRDCDIAFYIWGDGDYVPVIKEMIRDEGLKNIHYMGFVDKKYIPSILSKCDLNILNYQNEKLFKYGCSNNKLFEYLASGKPVLSTVKMGYSLIKKYNCGLEANTIEESVEKLRAVYSMTDEEKLKLVANTKNAADQFEFAKLTNKLIDIIENEV